MLAVSDEVLKEIAAPSSNKTLIVARVSMAKLSSFAVRAVSNKSSASLYYKNTPVPLAMFILCLSKGLCLLYIRV